MGNFCWYHSSLEIPIISSTVKRINFRDKEDLGKNSICEGSFLVKIRKPYEESYEERM
ncbi:15149_t:CDS:2 [Funneliformis mosseae]|uniref:15149_t:CDS:1 n=1 Tax=Funneliformis mosseae TaxID=27381 RepID=A0A9N8WHF2_FUNMO|nr:15149_t:CDS:2 [Funneliformis mosseae]